MRETSDGVILIEGETPFILKRRFINESLRGDVNAQVGGIYRMNAGGAIGYLFTKTSNGKEISSGMFCHRLTEINSDQWDYFYNFDTKEVYEIVRAKELPHGGYKAIPKSQQ